MGSMTGWDWVAVAGIFLQVIGLGIAVFGVREQHQLLTDKPLNLWQAFLEWGGDTRSTVARVVFRRKPKHATIRAKGSTAGTATGTATATGEIDRRPPDGAPIDALVAFALERIEEVDDAARRRSDETDERLTETDKRLSSSIKEVRRHVDDVRGTLDKTRNAITGPEGHALRRTAFGLLVTLIGVTLTAASFAS